MKNKLMMNTQYIDFYLQENQITKEEFAKRCEISINELNDVYAQKDVDVSVLSKLVKFLKITADTFLFREKQYPTKIYLDLTKLKNGYTS